MAKKLLLLIFSSVFLLSACNTKTPEVISKKDDNSVQKAEITVTAEKKDISDAKPYLQATMDVPIDNWSEYHDDFIGMSFKYPKEKWGEVRNDGQGHISFEKSGIAIRLQKEPGYPNCECGPFFEPRYSFDKPIASYPDQIDEYESPIVGKLKRPFRKLITYNSEGIFSGPWYINPIGFHMEMLMDAPLDSNASTIVISQSMNTYEKYDEDDERLKPYMDDGMNEEYFHNVEKMIPEGFDNELDKVTGEFIAFVWTIEVDEPVKDANALVKKNTIKDFYYLLDRMGIGDREDIEGVKEEIDGVLEYVDPAKIGKFPFEKDKMAEFYAGRYNGQVEEFIKPDWKADSFKIKLNILDEDVCREVFLKEIENDWKIERIKEIDCE